MGKLKTIIKLLSVLGMGYAWFDGVGLISRMQQQTPHVGEVFPIFTAPIVGVDLIEVAILWAVMLASFVGLILTAPKPED